MYFIAVDGNKISAYLPQQMQRSCPSPHHQSKELPYFLKNIYLKKIVIIRCALLHPWTSIHQLGQKQLGTKSDITGNENWKKWREKF